MLREWWYRIGLVTETASFDRWEWEQMYRTGRDLAKGKGIAQEMRLSVLGAVARRLGRMTSGTLKGFSHSCSERGPISGDPGTKTIADTRDCAPLGMVYPGSASDGVFGDISRRPVVGVRELCARRPDHHI